MVTDEQAKKIEALLASGKPMSEEARSKAKAALAEHESTKGQSLIPTGGKNWVERLSVQNPPESIAAPAVMPEHPTFLGSLGDQLASSLGSAAVGLDNGVTAGILHRLASAELPMGTEHGKSVADSIQAKTAHGLANQPGETTADTMERVSEEDPLSSGAGGLASLLFGGVPALVEGGIGRAMGRVGLKAAPSAIAKQTGLGALRGVGTALATGGLQDAAEAADLASRDKPVDMSNEGAKTAIRALLGFGGGALGGALGARAASNLDPMTSAGAGGTAQQITKLRRQGGDIGLAGVDVPPTLKPLYEEAMTGGTEITPRVGGLSHENQEAPGTFSPASRVEDVAAEKALGPVQRGIAEVDRGQAQKFAAIDDAFYNSPSVQRQRFVPTKIADTLKRFAQARVMDDGTPVPYANAGEPIKELNKLFNVGAPIREFDKHAELLAAQPGSFALPMEEAAKLGLVPNVSRGASGAPGAGEKAFVVITPKQVSPQQFEQAMAGVNNAAKAAEVRGAPDALHAELQQAGFRDREQIQWPSEVPWPAGVSREVAFTIPGDKGSTTLRDWAAIQAQKAERLGNLERDLFFMGTTPAEATNETTGARSILNALKQVGGPGASRTERSLSKFAVNQEGGREALNDMESVNTIEGASGLRKKLGAEGANPFSAHNRHALGLRLDPAMRAAGTILPRAGAVTPLDDRKAIQMLLGLGPQRP